MHFDRFLAQVLCPLDEATTGKRNGERPISPAQVDVEIPICGGWSLSFSDSAGGGGVDHLGGHSSDRAGAFPTGDEEINYPVHTQPLTNIGLSVPQFHFDWGLGDRQGRVPRWKCGIIKPLQKSRGL